MKNGDIPFPWLWGIFAKEVVYIVNLIDTNTCRPEHIWQIDNSYLNTEAFIHSYHFMLKDLWHGKYCHGVLNKWKLKGCSTLTFCVFILRWAHIWHIFCFIHFHSLHTIKKCTWHVINIYTEISMNGHLEGKIWTSINIPTYPFQTRPLLRRLHLQDPKLSGICTKGHSRRAMNVWLEFGIHVYHRYYIFEPIKHNKRKYTLSIVICACKSTVKALEFFLCLERRSTAVQHWWFGNSWLGCMNKTKQTGPSCQILHRNAQKENLSAQNRDSPIDFLCLALAKRERCEINDLWWRPLLHRRSRHPLPPAANWRGSGKLKSRVSATSSKFILIPPWHKNRHNVDVTPSGYRGHWII